MPNWLSDPIQGAGDHLPRCFVTFLSLNLGSSSSGGIYGLAMRDIAGHPCGMRNARTNNMALLEAVSHCKTHWPSRLA